jgi:hypothetical protein
MLGEYIITVGQSESTGHREILVCIMIAKEWALVRNNYNCAGAGIAIL